MLLRVILENFLSFDTAQEFNMFPNLRLSGNRHHIYSNYDIQILKQAAIYGNNAAGKSNLIKGIRTLRNFILDESFLNKRLIERLQYRLKKEEDRSPIELLIEFEFNQNYFIYDVAFSQDGVNREDLYLSGVGRTDNTLLYHRSFSDIKLSDHLLEKNKQSWQHTEKIVNKMLSDSHRYASFISLLRTLPIIDDKRLSSVYSWFKEGLSIIEVTSELPHLIALLHRDNEMLSFVKDMFSKLSIGVEGVYTRETDLEDWLSSHTGALSEQDLQEIQSGHAISAYSSPNRPVFTALMENGKTKIQELLFKQLSESGKFDLDVQDQSDGTLRILTILPAIYDAVKSNRVVVIDEINHCLHPQLLFDLIRFFSHSDTKGQLIFSTHETELFESERLSNNSEQSECGKLLRRDEIWLVEKQQGSSRLYSLNEFRIHNTICIGRGYREGRFGGGYQGNLIQRRNEEA